jgi:DNA-directed RNA polymerase specialized sigma24 family protein
MPDEENVSHWIELVKDGDSLAANQIWAMYFERLTRAIRGRLVGQNRAVSDEEDIVLSVFDSFYGAAQAGRFPDLADRDGLWQVLLRMSARKIVDKRRHDGRQRRGGGVKIGHFDNHSTSREELQAVGDSPSPDMILMMKESVEELFSCLGVGPLQDLAGAKLEGYSNRELARKFECSERTIERRLHLIREKFQQKVVDSDEHSPQTHSDPRPGTD